MPLCLAACIVSGFVLFFVQSPAQTRPVTPPIILRTGVEQGLSSRSLTAMVQDREGMYWIATQNGLNRYDGVEITVFNANGDSASLPSNAVTHLHVDKRGRLWVATESGLALYHAAKRTFTTYLRGRTIADIAEDSEGILWLILRVIGTKTQSLCAFDPNTALERHFEAGQKGLRSSVIHDIQEDAQQRLWLATANGLYRYERSKHVFTPFLIDESASLFAKQPRSRVYAVARLGNALWIGTDAGLGYIADTDRYIADTGKGALEGAVTWSATEGGVLALLPYQNHLFAAIVQAGTAANTLRFQRVTAITATGTSAQMGEGIESTNAVSVLLLEGKMQRSRITTDAKGNVWWGMGNGVLTFSSEQFRAELQQFSPENGSASRGVMPVPAVVVDNATQIPVFARANAGIERFVANRPTFKQWNTSPQLASPQLLAQSVSALLQTSDGAVWIGYRSGEGASRLDPKTGAITHLRHDGSNPQSLSGLDGQTSILALYEDTQRQIWFGGYAADRWQGAGNAVTHFSVLPGETVPVTAFCEDNAGGFWVGSAFGLALLDRTTGKVERFVNKPNNDNSLGNNIITALLKGKNGVLWIGHEGGLDRFDPKNRQFTHILTNSLNEASVPMSAVTCFFDDGESVWVGTRTGLYRLETASGKVLEHFAKQDGITQGLPDAHVAAIVRDNQGNIWVSTQRGLCRMTRQKGATAFRHFTVNDGLADMEFLDRAALCANDGRLYFGTASGLTVFSPDDIAPSLVRPIARITELRVLGTQRALPEMSAEATWGAKTSNQALELSYDDKVFSIHFAAPDITGEAEKFRYAYKLVGFDADWCDAGTLRSAKYTSLPAGEYAFIVKAANADGVWSETVSELRITVLPPWWRTWWFYALVGVVVFGGLFVGYAWRVRTIQAKNRELERLVGERTHLLQEANVEISRQLEILNEQAKEIEITNSQLQETNLVLDNTILDLKATQGQLVQSERLNAAGMLTAGVMHEINNPTASVSSALELVEQRLSSLGQYFISLLDDRDRNSPEAQKFVMMIDKAKEILNVAFNGTERIRTIVASLQGFTKHQYEGKTTNSIAEEIHTTVQIFGYQFKDVQVEATIPPDWRVEGSWAELNQAILNLLVNAAQAGATKIDIIADPHKNGTMTLCVCDNGKGMSAEVQSHIFEPFFTTKNVGNSGLGLSITKKIIEQHGGQIAVESCEGKGTTITLTLPTGTLLR